MRVGEYPWVGAGEIFRLSPQLVHLLRSQRIFSLADTCLDQTLRGRRRWKTAQELGLTGEHAAEWNRFLNLLVTIFFHLGSELDRIIWTKNPKSGQYSAKLGYEVAIKELIVREDQWWRKRLWKIQSPLKTIITMWLALSNKLLTWEMLKKRGFEGPGICTLCKLSDEMSYHCFPYTHM